MAHTLRRFGDLTIGPQALTGVRDLTPRGSGSARGARRAAPSALVLALLMAMVTVTGCGPIGYMQQVHRRASEAVEEARRAGAESAAPYEYTAAVAYLAKAREEGAEAEYGSAIELGRRAEDLALQARTIARRRSPPGGPQRAAARPSEPTGTRDVQTAPATQGTGP